MDSSFVSYAKKNKKVLLAAVLIVLGALLIISSSLGGGKKEESEKTEITLDEYKERLEAEVSSLCASVDGVGKCKVFITFERGEQNVYKGSAIIESRPPRVQGVTVVCKGAESDSVRSRLTDMMTALFDVGSNRVAILKLNS